MDPEYESNEDELEKLALAKPNVTLRDARARSSDSCYFRHPVIAIEKCQIVQQSYVNAFCIIALRNYKTEMTNIS